jgi:small-conductance mechanosensitive channel
MLGKISIDSEFPASMGRKGQVGTVEQFVEAAFEYFEMLLGVVSRPATLQQLGIIILLYVLARLLARWAEPRLEVWARKIKGMRRLLRFVVGLLRRLRWLLFVLLLAFAAEIAHVLAWPGSNYLIQTAALLSSAWLVITVVSNAIRSRTIGRLFALAVWLLVAAKILGVADSVISILDAIGFDVGSTRISLWAALRTLAYVGVIMWLASLAGNFVDNRVQRLEEMTPSLRVLIGKTARIALVVLAAMIAMEMLNIDLTSLHVLSGAIGVGIGFGLQKVVSNFIAGIIILMDESIKPGDTITLGETFGWIRELRARFVSVITRDGREFLIPNEDFITHEVVNWSFSDRFVRLDVPFGVSYRSDPHQVAELAIAAASSVARVDTRKTRPVCWMTEFGESSLKFLLRFWIDDPQRGLTNIRGKVLLALWDTFKEHGIEIPFPQREITIKNAPTPVVEQAPDSDD